MKNRIPWNRLRYFLIPPAIFLGAIGTHPYWFGVLWHAALAAVIIGSLTLFFRFRKRSR